jgi:hypothetical protein
MGNFGPKRGRLISGCFRTVRRPSADPKGLERRPEIAVEQVDVVTRVKLGEWCPSHFWTSTAFRSSANRPEATVCLNVWNPAHSTPASELAGERTGIGSRPCWSRSRPTSPIR